MSALEDALAQQITLAGLPAPLREYRFAAPRRWRLDFAWPDIRLAVEVEGGTWAQGRHNRPAGFAGDCEKYNRLTLLGWRLLRFTAEMIRDGRALAAIEEAIDVIVHEPHRNDSNGRRDEIG